MPGGPRRLANVRKLMRLAREHEAAHGSDLHGLPRARGAARRAFGRTGRRGARKSEAPVEGEALDAVRLMTIHRAKGLEFDVVCVADLGRGPRWRAELMRVGRDGRFGLRLAEPGTGRRESALDYKALGEERQAAEAREERRLFYVAMTRARERLILSGAAKLEAWPGAGSGAGGRGRPDRVDRAGGRAAATTSPRSSVTFVRRRRTVRRGRAPAVPAAGPPRDAGAADARRRQRRHRSVPRATGGRAQLLLARRVQALRLPLLRRARAAAAGAGSGGAGRRPPGGGARLGAAGGLSAAERGTLVHALLERLDFRRPAVATEAAVAAAAARFGLTVAPGGADAAQIIELVDRFAAGELCRRLGRATGVRREERFRFLLGSDPGVLIGGVFDVIAREPGGRTLVVDYKTDRLDGADPQALADARLRHAAAGLRARGADGRRRAASRSSTRSSSCRSGPRWRHFTRDQLPDARGARSARWPGGCSRREFTVTEAPHRGVCDGCPAEGGLCSWPLEMTRREAPDRCSSVRLSAGLGLRSWLPRSDLDLLDVVALLDLGERAQGLAGRRVRRAARAGCAATAGAPRRR